MRFVTMIMLFFYSTVAQAQLVDPPSSADEFGWLRWAVIILLGIVVTGGGTFFAFVKGAYESRITDKDAEISRLVDRLSTQQQQLDRLQADKDLLNKDMQEKVIPALTSASDLIRTFLNSVKK